MLLSFKDPTKFKVEATNGSIGHLHSLLFDEQSWIVRYLVVDTGALLPGRKVLLPPSIFGDLTGQVFPVALTREQVKNSPEIDTELPVSRQQEMELHNHFDWTPYWTGSFSTLTTATVPEVEKAARQAGAEPGAGKAEDTDNNPHLRSTRAVINYRISAEDGDIGHVEDFIVDDADWLIRYLVVDTRNWLPGKKVIIPPDWIKHFSWDKAEISVNVTQEAIEKSPEFDPDAPAPVNRDYETLLYDYYDRSKYWL